MPQPAPTDYGVFFRTYIDKAAIYASAAEAVQSTFTVVKDVLQTISDVKSLYAYAPGKWTLKEMLQHITDTERIMTYRALCIARGETISLPGFEENDYAEASGANYRKWEHIVEEWTDHRKSLIQFFKGLNEPQLQQYGLVNTNPITPNALGFIIAGHSLHHAAIIRERYVNETYTINI